MSSSAYGGFTKITITVRAFVVQCLITYQRFVSGQLLIAYLREIVIQVVTHMMGISSGSDWHTDAH